MELVIENKFCFMCKHYVENKEGKPFCEVNHHTELDLVTGQYKKLGLTVLPSFRLTVCGKEATMYEPRKVD